MNIPIIGIIPARYASTRLPGKPLIDICGKTLIQRVWENACRSELLSKVIIATDDERIASHCKEIGAEYIMTPSELQSGSDRVIYAYHNLNDEYKILVNIQGDEPFLTGEIIDNLLNNFIKSEADVGTLIKKITNNEELFDPSIVKVVLRNDMTAMYFSRQTIPFIRDKKPDSWLDSAKFWKHIGIYAYRKEALLKFESFPQSALEQSEKLEQLRLLEQGAKYLCVETGVDLIGIDTEQDLEKARKILS